MGQLTKQHYWLSNYYFWDFITSGPGLTFHSYQCILERLEDQFCTQQRFYFIETRIEIMISGWTYVIS